VKAAREDIYSALFETLKGISGVKTFSRTVLVFTDVSPDDQPALYMEQTGERQIKRALKMPNLWELQVSVGIYVNVGDNEGGDIPADGAGDQTPVPASYLNPILDQIEALFPGTDVISKSSQTLDNLVVQVRLAEDEKTLMGSLGPQAFAFVPLRIIAI